MSLRYDNPIRRALRCLCRRIEAALTRDLRQELLQMRAEEVRQAEALRTEQAALSDAVMAALPGLTAEQARQAEAQRAAHEALAEAQRAAHATLAETLAQDLRAGLERQDHAARSGQAELMHGLEQAVEQLRAGQSTLAAELRAEVDALRVRLGEGLAPLAAGQAAHLDALAALGARVQEAITPPPDATTAFMTALNGLGILNYENNLVSGEWRFLDRYLRQAPEAVVLDVGANEGQFATLARQAGPRATIHSFEPHPHAYAALAERAAPLGVTAHPLALSDSAGTASFYDYVDEPGSQHASLYRDVIERVHGRPATAIEVRCETLDTIAAELGLDHIGLLKIDTEGHELAVLKGAHGLLERGAIDVIQFEFNEMNVIARVFMKDFFDLLPQFHFYRLLSDRVIDMDRYDPRSMEIFAFQNIACIRRDLDPAWLTRPDG